MTKGNREAEKKRLIEALIGFPLTDSIKVTGTDCVFISRRDAEDLADKLIDANGVIVPPCKVGDTVYDIDGFPKIGEAEVETITTDGQEMSSVVVNPQKPFHRWFVNWKDINKTVFLTREEAEKALKEAQNG